MYEMLSKPVNVANSVKSRLGPTGPVNLTSCFDGPTIRSLQLYETIAHHTVGERNSARKTYQKHIKKTLKHIISKSQTKWLGVYRNVLIETTYMVMSTFYRCVKIDLFGACYVWGILSVSAFISKTKCLIYFSRMCQVQNDLANWENI